VSAKTIVGTLIALAGVRVAPARAEWVSRAGVSVGATDNAVGATFTDQGGEVATADGFAMSKLGLGYVLHRPKTVASVLYTVDLFSYTRTARELRLNHELALGTTISPGRDVDFGFFAGAGQGRTSDVDFFSGTGSRAPTTTVTAGMTSYARPVGSDSFATVNAGQDFSWRFIPDWGLHQGFSGSAFEPLADDPTLPRTLSGEVRLALDHAWTRDTLGLEARAGQGRAAAFSFLLPPMLTSATQPIPADHRVPIPARHADFGDVGLYHEHELGPRWSTYLKGGATFVRVPGDTFSAASGNASLVYRSRGEGKVTLFADRGVYPNVFVGDVFLQNGVGLRVQQPLGSFQRMLLTAGVDYQRSHSVFVVDIDQGQLELWAGRASLSYEAGRHLRYLLETTYTHQDAGTSKVYGFEFPGSNLRRLMAMLTVEVQYPQPERKADKRRSGAAPADTGEPADAPAEDPGGDDPGDGDAGGGEPGGQAGNAP
jgi:hypothetical protein